MGVKPRRIVRKDGRPVYHSFAGEIKAGGVKVWPLKHLLQLYVGSFELELGIYEISGKYGIREIDHLRHVLALGKDTYNDGKITYVLVDEMCQVLREFMEVMKPTGFRITGPMPAAPEGGQKQPDCSGSDSGTDRRAGNPD